MEISFLGMVRWLVTITISPTWHVLAAAPFMQQIPLPFSPGRMYVEIL